MNTDELNDIKRILSGEKTPEQKKRDREQKLMLLGYNQAMLDYAEFPIKQDNGEVLLSREDTQRVVKSLRKELDK